MSGVRIFDTTLRDGEQAPGFSMDVDGKLRVAQALAALRVDVIEAGFAAASPGDAAAISAVAARIEGPIICSLARAIRGDIDAAALCLAAAPRKRIHVFLGTSPIHREAKLHMSRGEVLAAIRDSVARARDLVDDVEFSAEDAIRTERDFLVECLSVAAEAGASTLNVPDTVGYTTPEEIYDLFRFLGEQVDAAGRDASSRPIAMTISAWRSPTRSPRFAAAPARSNARSTASASAPAIARSRTSSWRCAPAPTSTIVSTGVDTTKIMAASRTLAQVTNVSPPRNKAIVGVNAFAHEAGIHQHGVLQNRATYEIMKPEDIGLSTDGIVLGKHSGRHALVLRARELGFALEGETLDAAFHAFKQVADEVGIVDSARLVGLLIGLEDGQDDRRWALSKLEIRTPASTKAWPVARVELEHGKRGRVTDLASAPGALDAIFTSISQIMDVPARVDALELQYVAADPDEAPEDGQGAKVLVEIALDVGGEIFSGRARDRDILPCCVAAYIDAASNAETIFKLRADQMASAQAA